MIKSEKITIEKIVAGGDGLGRLSDGRVIFVPDTIPHERVSVRVTVNKKDYAKGIVTDILEASPLRGEPKCPYYQSCGGCNLQHVQDEYQYIIKREMFKQTMQRMAGLEVDELFSDFEVIGGGSWEYRTRARFHADPARKSLGFLSKDSHHVVDISSCPILDPRLDQLLRIKKDSWLSGKGKLRSIPCSAIDSGVVIGEGVGKVSLETEHFGRLGYHIDGAVFFQSNLAMLTILIDTLFPSLHGKQAMDLFSGVGTFSQVLQQRFSSVTAVERDPRCLSLAQKNVDPEIVSFYTDAVEHWVKGKNPYDIDLVVVDPPRTGLPPGTADMILSWRPKKILYISCDPVTLGRDLKGILGRSYSLQDLYAFDFYPQSSHLEAAALITRDTLFGIW